MPRGFLVRRRSPCELSAFHPVPMPIQSFWFDPRMYLYADPPPLDLSLKSATPITPPLTPSPSTPPPRKRTTSEDESDQLVPKSAPPHTGGGLKTPPKKTKAVRRLDFDEDTTSPVSGTIIRRLGEDEPPLVVRKGDIDPAYNLVEVTDEAKAELAKIENHIGDYICRLCKQMYEDAFGLAQHRCSRIVHVEYRCPECDKVFNCPANLASHRRWHRPRQAPPVTNAETTTASRPLLDNSATTVAADLPCPICHKMFRRQAYLRKHLATHTA